MSDTPELDYAVEALLDLMLAATIDVEDDDLVPWKEVLTEAASEAGVNLETALASRGVQLEELEDLTAGELRRRGRRARARIARDGAPL